MSGGSCGLFVVVLIGQLLKGISHFEGGLFGDLGVVDEDAEASEREGGDPTEEWTDNRNDYSCDEKGNVIFIVTAGRKKI